MSKRRIWDRSKVFWLLLTCSSFESAFLWKIYVSFISPYLKIFLNLLENLLNRFDRFDSLKPFLCYSALRAVSHDQLSLRRKFWSFLISNEFWHFFLRLFPTLRNRIIKDTIKRSEIIHISSAEWSQFSRPRSKNLHIFNFIIYIKPKPVFISVYSNKNIRVSILKNLE